MSLRGKNTVLWLPVSDRGTWNRHGVWDSIVLWPLACSDQLPGNAIFTVTMDWNVYFVHSSCVQYLLLQQMVVALFRSDSWVALQKENASSENWTVGPQKQAVQLKSELPGVNSHFCWKKFSPPRCKALKDEQRCWPWSSRNRSILTSFVQCNHCFWRCRVEGCSNVCCGKMTQYFLLPLAQNPFGPTQYIRYSWPPLGHIRPPVLKCTPRMAGSVGGALCNEEPTSPSAQCCSQFCDFCLLSCSTDVMPCSLSLFQSQLKFTCVLPPSPPKVYRAKTWLA